MPGVTLLAGDKVQSKTLVSSFPVQCYFQPPQMALKLLILQAPPVRLCPWAQSSGPFEEQLELQGGAGQGACLEVYFLHCDGTNQNPGISVPSVPRCCLNQH